MQYIIRHLIGSIKLFIRPVIPQKTFQIKVKYHSTFHDSTPPRTTIYFLTLSIKEYEFWETTFPKMILRLRNLSFRLTPLQIEDNKFRVWV